MTTKRNNDSLSGIMVVPPKIVSGVSRFMPDKDFSALPHWKEFSTSVQRTIIHETNSLAGATVLYAGAKLAMGAHIARLHDLCGGSFDSKAQRLVPGKYDGTFRRIMASRNIHERQVYRLMNGYNAARTYLTDNVFMAAIANGLEFTYSKEQPLGKYTDVIREFPAPKNPSNEDADRYIKQLMVKQKARMRALRDGKKVSHPSAEDIENQIALDPITLQRSCYRAIKNALKNLSGAAKRRWLEHLVGYAMREAGMQGTRTFEPLAPPEDFTREPGRPRTTPEEGAA